MRIGKWSAGTRLRLLVLGCRLDEGAVAARVLTETNNSLIREMRIGFHENRREIQLSPEDRVRLEKLVAAR